MTWRVPNPPNGASGVPSSEQADQDAKFYGEDIYFDIAAADVTLGEADYVVTADGDWAVVTGREALRQSLLRRLITAPGEWQTKPDYGVGARQYVKAKNTGAVRDELDARIRTQFLRDPRVERVDVVTVAQLDDGSAGLKISVLVTPRGRLRSDQPLPVRLEMR
jgi:phage baseplate assembly protein W